MAVEIREIVIRANTTTDDQSCCPSANSNSDTDGEAAASTLDREALLQECVRLVLKILKSNNER